MITSHIDLDHDCTLNRHSMTVNRQTLAPCIVSAINSSGKRQSIVMAFALICASSSAHGADAESGRRLAQSQCTGCHIVAPGARQEVAQAPPFEAIARKFGANSDLLIAAIRGPHPKMNFAPTPRDTDDLAAFIGTLAR